MYVYLDDIVSALLGGIDSSYHPIYIPHFTPLPHILPFRTPNPNINPPPPGGSLGITTNRTKWPMNGGKISIIPGWNAGHPTAFFYVNMGYGSIPVNHSHPMVGVFQITGPSRDAYPGTFCLQGVPLPVNATDPFYGNLKPGDNATIQVIQVALHGASLYNVSGLLSWFVDGDMRGLIGGCGYYIGWD